MDDFSGWHLIALQAILVVLVGGTYSAVKGIYTENITFFSRDNSRVGAELSFEFAVKNGDWHHSGKSSKGDPIYEIWSPYTKAYKVSF